jgi:hypothetical protein
MKPPKHLLIVFALAAGSAFADAKSFQSGTAAAPPAHPAMYSFADVYRLTVAGAMAGMPLADGAPEAPLRVAAAQGQAAEARFLVAPVPPRDTWLLVLAGLALAGWVAHRRLAHTL